eukprot:41400-Alexandrium_andersonii.AAC.1
MNASGRAELVRNCSPAIGQTLINLQGHGPLSRVRPARKLTSTPTSPLRAGALLLSLGRPQTPE